jgi:hypothetical protein
MYFNKGGSHITERDSATTYIKFFKRNKTWYGMAYYATNTLRSEGSYREFDHKTPIGTFKNYSAEGFLSNITIWNDSSKAVERTYFYKNGGKRGWVRYELYDVKEQKCWDSLGKELNICNVEVEAKFKGGINAWRMFLEKNLNADVAVSAGAPEGIYTVKAQFIVAKDGSLSDIKATDVPAGCKPCGKEVERILSLSPNWEPALINGDAVLYQAIQPVSFQVIEEKRRRRRN